ncbi:GAF domain-containing protein [Pseudarthrobacter sp. P1]|uniref:sensor histidine kinase n=1 Tax=Pseudarthrobacter sp. P1 TaxID=3418418 RepID=UPI003CF4FB7F
MEDSQPHDGPTILPPSTVTRIEDLLKEFVSRAGELLHTQERMAGLLSAVVSIAEELSLDAVLRRVVESACHLLKADYGALGVIGEGQELSHFVTQGIDADLAALIGPLPTGHGVLGLLIRDPRPIRLPNLHAHPASSGFPEHHPPMDTFLGVPIRVRNTVFGNLYLTQKQGGGLFTAEDEDLAVALAAAAGFAIENAKLFGDARLRSRWLEACMHVAGTMMGSEAPGADSGPALVAATALEVSDSAVVLVGVPAREQALPTYICAAAGEASAGFLGQSLHLDPAVVHRVLSTGEPVAFDSATDILGSTDGAPLGPVLVVALGTLGVGQGVLVLARTAGDGRYSAATMEMAALYGAQCALALELARARTLREQLVLAADRDRIARDLHDVVIQRLFAAGLSIQTLKRFTGDPRATERIGTVTAELDATIRDLRDTIYSLRATSGQRDLLSSQILRSVKKATRPLPFTPRLHLAGPIDSDIPAEIAGHVLAVLSEGLSNSVRHSGAGTIEVTVAVDDGRLTVTVDDDGCGFSAPVRRSGLANLDHRARELNGRFSVDSAPGEGTRLAWSVPLGAGPHA